MFGISSSSLRELKEERKDMAHYVLPIIFFEDDRYKKIPLGAKFLYAVIRDRINLSKKNYRLDIKENNFYCYFSNDKLAKLFGVSRRTIINYKNILLKNNLIYYVVQSGYGKSNKIFLNKESLFDIEKSIKEENFYKVSKKVLVDETFKDLSLREKIFYQVLDNKKSCPAKTTFNSRNINASKPTIIKYKDKLLKQKLISKKNSKITVIKTLLKSVKEIYINSINKFMDNVKSLISKSRKKDKKSYKKVIKRLINTIKYNLSSCIKYGKSKFFDYIEHILELRMVDMEKIINELIGVEFSKINGVRNYISKILNKKIEDRKLQNEREINKLFNVNLKFWDLVKTY